MSRREQIEQMLSENPKDTFLRYALAMELGNDECNEEEHERAIQMHRSLMADDPPYVPAFFMLGQQLTRMERIDEARVAYHREILAGYDLAMTPPGNPAFSDIAPLLARDKKALDGITFILDGVDGCEVVENVDVNILERAYERFIA